MLPISGVSYVYLVTLNVAKEHHPEEALKSTEATYIDEPLLLVFLPSNHHPPPMIVTFESTTNNGSSNRCLLNMLSICKHTYPIGIGRHHQCTVYPYLFVFD